MNNNMPKPELASIFNLEFYRKQKKWRFVREVLSEHAPLPECSHSARALLNQTYNVEVPVELPVPAALDEAFIDSANGADPSSDEATRELPDMVDFREEEQLLLHAQVWLEQGQQQRQRQWQQQWQEQWQRQERQEQRERLRGGSPPLHCDLDYLDGVGYADDNLLMDKLNLRPRDQLLAWSPGGGSPPASDSPPPSAPPSPRSRSLDSAGFMLGAHAAPHSSEIELCPGDSLECAAPLTAQVRCQARALQSLLRLARGEAQRLTSTRSAHDITSFEEFPTRDVGPGEPPAAPSTPPSPPVAGRGRGRRGEPPVVWVSAGRPYRL